MKSGIGIPNFLIQAARVYVFLADTIDKAYLTKYETYDLSIQSKQQKATNGYIDIEVDLPPEVSRRSETKTLIISKRNDNTQNYQAVDQDLRAGRQIRYEGELTLRESPFGIKAMVQGHYKSDKNQLYHQSRYMTLDSHFVG